MLPPCAWLKHIVQLGRNELRTGLSLLQSYTKSCPMREFLLMPSDLRRAPPALAADDEWLILASDGLFANVERGGGGGLENQDVVDMCNNSVASPEQLAKKLAFAAQEAGSTDDVTVVVVQLGK